MRNQKESQLAASGRTSQDRWVYSYADFVTLLFAFFAVMYGVSSINLGKYRALAEEIKDSNFQQTIPDKLINLPDFQTLPVSAEQPLRHFSGLPWLQDAKQSKPLTQQLIPDKVLNKFVPDGIKYTSHQDWVEIELTDTALFASGSAVPESKAAESLTKLGKQLAQQPYFISVQGYTDNIPVSDGPFSDNWQLSAARAASVVTLLASAGVDASKLTAIGYGSEHPRADNATADGRRENRRVIIVVARNASVAQLLKPQQSTFKKKAAEAAAAAAAKAEAEKNRENVVKEVRTESGGLRFTRGTEEKSTKRSVEP